MPQLAFIKQLSINDSRVKLDSFLENYFFKKDYIIYKKIAIRNHITNIKTKTLNRTFSYINKLALNKLIIYSFKNIQHNDIFLINNSLNYSELKLYSDVYINMNNNAPEKNLEVNNNIRVIIDFNQNLKITLLTVSILYKLKSFG